MDAYVIQCLCEIHHSVYTVNDSEFSGEKAETVEKLGEYLIGHPVEASEFEPYTRKVKEEIENFDSEDEA